ncbi:uncharacterized protein K02A2.6-like [Mercenaria mercenaria]|uniref:uncharacterized protein K02A2.6-like n=1 Tax=Mercenaria mercenaria TaxID=6596 RepID=UPI00234E3ABD|nr:uncharacterized protein K02A2.6-like [Mercenaria mercenaria]
MARYGICDKLVTDNGPQFSAELFSDFAKEWVFSHVTSSPLHPISNGLAEKTVSIVKRIFTKAHESDRDPCLAILEYRNTPLECGFSPNQLLMGRKTKSILPITDAQLQPKTVSPKLVSEKMHQIKQKQKSHYDKTAKKLPPLSLNESVRIQVNKTWEPAKVIKIHNDRSYSVQTPRGGIYRRNRCKLNKTKENFPDIQEFSPEILAQNRHEEPLPLQNDREIPTADDADPSSTPDKPSQTEHYVTRSGREVKSNRRYYNEN